VVPACLQPLPKVFHVEANPRVVRAASLIKMNHLVILYRIPILIEMVGIFLAMGNDVSKESHAFISLPNPEGNVHCLHIAQPAGTTGTEHHGKDAEETIHISQQN